MTDRNFDRGRGPGNWWNSQENGLQEQTEPQGSFAGQRGHGDWWNRQDLGESTGPGPHSGGPYSGPFDQGYVNPASPMGWRGDTFGRGQFGSERGEWVQGHGHGWRGESATQSGIWGHGPQRRGTWGQGPPDHDFGSRSQFGAGDWGYEETWHIPGPHTGRGPRGYQRSDQRIEEDVCERLTHHGQIDASDIEIAVSDGEVTLTGTVEDRRIKRMAEEALDTIPGIRDVHNQLRVDHGQRQHQSASSNGQGQQRGQRRQTAPRNETQNVGAGTS